MKSLRMKSGFLYTIFGLQILLGCNNVWAAEDDFNVEPDTEMGGMDFEKLLDRFTHWKSDKKDGNSDTEHGNSDTKMGGIDFGLENSKTNDDSNDNNIVEKKQAIKANDMFLWPSSESSSCDKNIDALDLSLNEALILTENSIRYLGLINGWEPYQSVKTLRHEHSNGIMLTAQLWGMSWINNGGGHYQIHKKDVLSLVQDKYDVILRSLTTKPDPSRRIRLLCGDTNIMSVINEDTKKEYWQFRDFKNSMGHHPLIEKTAEYRSLESICAKTDTFVWNNLILFCDSIWTKGYATLNSMIVNQDIVVEDTTLDHKMTLGGVVMHVLLHVLKLAGDVEIDENYKLHGGRPFRNPVKFIASSFYWCVALARKDFRLDDDIKNRRAPKSAANFVLYGTGVTLDRIPWGDREAPRKIPNYINSHAAWRSSA